MLWIVSIQPLSVDFREKGLYSWSSCLEAKDELMTISRLRIVFFIGLLMLVSLATTVEANSAASESCLTSQIQCDCKLPCLAQQSIPASKAKLSADTSVSIKDAPWISTAIIMAGIIFALFLFRKPLISLTERARKISYKDWSIDLEKVSMGSEQFDLDRMMSIDVQDSGQQAIREMIAQIIKTKHTEYVVVDLGDGTQWWGSRLYLLARLLTEMTETQLIVFVEKLQRRRVFVTALSPELVWRSLENREEVFANSFELAAPQGVGILVEDEDKVHDFIQQYLSNLCNLQPAPPQDEIPDGYQKTKYGAKEKTFLVSADLIFGLGNFENSLVQVQRRESSQEVSQGVLNSEGRFVAVVDNDLVFMYLVDRFEMLEKAWLAYRDVLEH